MLKNIQINTLGKFIDYSDIEFNKVMTKQSDIPKGENILYFSAIFSQNYGLGEKNRNGYKIDPKGWALDNYKKNAIILYQHDYKMPIGKAIDIFINEQGDLAGTFYIDTNNIESEADKNRIINGYVNGISTGHITIDDAIEDNKTGERLPVSDALEKWNCWSALWGDDQNYTYVVIKCEMLENSMVTLPSNSDALVTMNNSITDSIQERHKNLLDKYKNNMETKNNTEEVIAIDEVAEEVVVETPTEEVQEAEISAEVEEVVKTEEVVEDNNIDEKIIEAINNSEVIKGLFNAVSRLSNSINSIIDASTNDISSSTVKRKELKLEGENNSDIYSDIAQSSFGIKN